MYWPQVGNKPLTIVFVILQVAFLMPTIEAEHMRVESAGVYVPEGFQATLYADDDLVHDIFSMTVDSRGRLAVSGPGYIKILEDTDDDGFADMAIPFADGPASGAQGLCFVGRD